jgi:Ca2+-binding EF-hand superfamily protein
LLSASKIRKQQAARAAEREKEVEEAFDLADDDGNGVVNAHTLLDLFVNRL